jgi:hypothetical protein
MKIQVIMFRMYKFQCRVRIHKYRHQNKTFLALAILLFTILLNNNSQILQMSTVHSKLSLCRCSSDGHLVDEMLNYF